MGPIEGIGEQTTLINLSRYKSLRKGKTDLVFRRAITPSSGILPQYEYLEIVPLNKLTWWQSVLRFFGHSAYRHETVSRLIQQAEQKYSDFKPTMPEYLNIVSAIHHVNKEMTRVRGTKILGLFLRTVPSDIPIVVPSLADIKQEPAVAKPKPIPTPLLQATQRPVYTHPPAYARSPGTIKGLVNPLCLCYDNSSLKLLWTSTGLREMLKQSHSPAARLLELLFAELEKGGDPPLAHAQGEEILLYEGSSPLKKLDRFLFEKATSPEMIFAKIALVDQQQDAEEFVSALLAEVLQSAAPDSKPLVTLHREKVRKDKITDKEQLEEARKKPSPPLAALRLGIIDSSERLQSNVVTMNIVGEEPSIQRFFNGTRYHETVYADAVIGDEENKKILSQEQKDALLKTERESPTHSLGEVEVEEKYILARGTSPPFLPIQVARFHSELQRNDDGTPVLDKKGRPIAMVEKDPTPIKVPFLLSVPVEREGSEEERSESYVLRGICVHRGGESIHSGHYVTYIPDPSAPLNAEGNPTKWFQQSDTVITPMGWDNPMLQEDITRNGYLYLYDRAL